MLVLRRGQSSGYFYRFDSAAVTTLATNDETTRYGANEYEAVGLGWAGKLSGGIRIELMPGVEWGTEYSLSLTSVSELEPVSNTRRSARYSQFRNGSFSIDWCSAYG